VSLTRPASLHNSIGSAATDPTSQLKSNSQT